MRLLLLILLLVAIVLILMGCVIAVLTWYHGHKDRSTGVNDTAGE
jgi:flagellar basal body-associated protein FliL